MAITEKEHDGPEASKQAGGPIPKFIYLARRKPSLSAEAFVARWRQHGALGMSRSNWANNMLSYVYADTLRPPPVAGLSIEYDGFCIGKPDGSVAFRAPTPEDKAITDSLPIDEMETFDRPTPHTLVFVDETVLKDGGPGVTAMLAFDDAERARTVAQAFSTHSELRRVVVNRVRHEMSSEKILFDFPAFVELSAADENALAAALQSGEGHGWREAKLALIGREDTIWDKRRAPVG